MGLTMSAYLCLHVLAYVHVCVCEKEIERLLYWLEIEFAPCRLYQSYSRDSVLAVVELLCTCYMSSEV